MQLKTLMIRRTVNDRGNGHFVAMSSLHREVKLKWYPYKQFMTSGKTRCAQWLMDRPCLKSRSCRAVDVARNTKSLRADQHLHQRSTGFLSLWTLQLPAHSRVLMIRILANKGALSSPFGKTNCGTNYRRGLDTHVESSLETQPSAIEKIHFF